MKKGYVIPTHTPRSTFSAAMSSALLYLIFRQMGIPPIISLGSLILQGGVWPEPHLLGGILRNQLSPAIQVQQTQAICQHYRVGPVVGE